MFAFDPKQALAELAKCAAGAPPLGFSTGLSTARILAADQSPIVRFAMRAFRFGPALALAAAAALSGNTANSEDSGQAANLAQIDLLTREHDQQLRYALDAIIASAEVGPDGELFFNSALGDQRFLQPNSGYYWQVSGEGQKDFRSRSLWDRRIKISGDKAEKEPLYYDSDQFPDEALRIAERTIRLPGSDVEWQFVVARGLERVAN